MHVYVTHSLNSASVIPKYVSNSSQVGPRILDLLRAIFSCLRSGGAWRRDEIRLGEGDHQDMPEKVRGIHYGSNRRALSGMVPH